MCTLRSELYRCGGDCGLLYPLLVDRRGATASCVACGSPASRLGEPDVIDELRRRMTALVGEPRGAPAPVIDTSPVDIHARVRAAQQVGDLLRYLERDPSTAGPPDSRTGPW